MRTAVVSLVVLVTGCVDRAAPPSRETPASRADYIARADRICGEAASRSEEILRFYEGVLNLNLPPIALYYEQWMAILREQESQLRDLGMPAGEGKRLLDMTHDEGRRLVKLGDTVVRVAHSGDVPSARVALRDFTLSRDRLLTLRREYGFFECARGAYSKEKTEYLAKGDDVCAELFHQLAKIQAPPVDARGAARYAGQVLPPFREATQALEKLAVPPSDVSVVGPMFVELEAAVTSVKTAAEASDEPTARANLREASTALVGGLQEANGSLAFRGAIRDARTYGFRDCGGLLRESLDLK